MNFPQKQIRFFLFYGCCKEKKKLRKKTSQMRPKKSISQTTHKPNNKFHTPKSKINQKEKEKIKNRKTRKKKHKND